VLDTLFAAMLVAAAIVLALWTDARLGRAAPAGAPTIVLHLASAWLAVAISPEVMHALDSSAPLATVGVLGVFLPALVYLFVASIWALKLVRRAVVR
jgi:hypothetical protein